MLKQLAEHPAPGSLAALSQYLARETDPDLVVHAVRVVRELTSSKALRVLIEQLGHSNWSVRAEAVEAIGKKLENTYMGGVVPDDAKVEAFAALTERLDDPDGFVVGRALTALKTGNLLVALEPLLRVADKHPELAAKVIETLFSGTSEAPAIKAKALPRLRKFAAHPRVDVRAAVVKALGDPAEKVVEPEVQAALSDSESDVRIAAAASAFRQVKRSAAPGLERSRGERPWAEMMYLGFDLDDEGAAAENGAGDSGGGSVESWLTRFQEGKSRPTWMEPTIAPLVKMLKAVSVEEQLAAAVPLVALGRKSERSPRSIDAGRRRPDIYRRSVPCAPLVAQGRSAGCLQEAHGGEPWPGPVRQDGRPACRCTRHACHRAPLGLTTRGELDHQAVYAINDALRRAYFGSRAVTQQKVPKAERLRVLADARPRAVSGPEWQRVFALGLLLSASPEDAAVAARSVIGDAKAPTAARRDAFQVLLLSGDSAQAHKEAEGALRGHEPAFQKLALYYLTSDSASLSTLREALPIHADTLAFTKLSSALGNTANALSEPVPTLPRWLTPELLRPLLKSADPELAALAGYSLSLLAEPAGLDTLLSYWRSQPADAETWDKRVYQAIAQLDDDAQVPVLEKIYAGARSGISSKHGDTSIIKDLYWTIRGMDGLNARRLRTRIRGEVGMPVLRGEESEATPF